MWELERASEELGRERKGQQEEGEKLQNPRAAEDAQTGTSGEAGKQG